MSLAGGIGQIQKVKKLLCFISTIPTSHESKNALDIHGKINILSVGCSLFSTNGGWGRSSLERGMQLTHRRVGEVTMQVEGNVKSNAPFLHPLHTATWWAQSLNPLLSIRTKRRWGLSGHLEGRTDRNWFHSLDLKSGCFGHLAPDSLATQGRCGDWPLQPQTGQVPLIIRLSSATMPS